MKLCSKSLSVGGQALWTTDFFSQQTAFRVCVQEGVRQGDYVLLKSANAYFDDASHHDELKGLCSFSHPLVDNGRRFPSLKALKQELKNTCNAQFCNICLEGRKVFLSEQLVYTKSQLNKHLKQGDDEGPMSTFSGFKGHPECVYCSKRFYGENEQYEHMHRFHEECFLCRRTSPHNHIYYANYAALEGMCDSLMHSSYARF